MPDWIVTTINTSALAGGCLFGMWAAVAIARFLGPRLSRFFEAHVNLIDSLRTNLQALTGLAERQVDMLDEQGKQLQAVAHQTEHLAELKDSVQELKHQVGRPRGTAERSTCPSPRWPTPTDLEQREQEQP